ncbi:MAG: ABC-2 family transporter protein [Clostridiales bacterium]|jgi:ABC-2 type transport system permease protein|nr:ABC-2 family transporter protein [Clostridiales bacterium]
MSKAKAILAYSAVAKTAFSGALEYRADFLFGLLSKGFPVVIQWYMWTAIFRNSQSAAVHGYSYGQMILYSVLAPLVSGLVAVSAHYQIADEIKNGRHSMYIVMPVRHFFFKLSEHIGGKCADAVFLAALLAAAYAVFASLGYVSPDAGGILAFALTAALAALLQFLISYALAAAAFWMGDCGGIFTVANIAMLIASGGVFPLDIFGGALLGVFRRLPFYYITYFPLGIIIGRVAPEAMAKGLAAMAAWAVALAIAGRLAWRQGEKRYIAAGG